MTVSVVTPGKVLDKDPKYTLSCKSCNCIFTANLSDTTGSYDQRDSPLERQINCPQKNCDATVFFKITEDKQRVDPCPSKSNWKPSHY